MALWQHGCRLRPARALLLLVVVGAAACTQSRDDSGAPETPTSRPTPSSTPSATSTAVTLTETVDVEGVTFRTPPGWSVNSQEDCLSEHPFERRDAERCPGIAVSGPFMPGEDPGVPKQRQPSDPCRDNDAGASSAPRSATVRKVRLEHETALTAVFACGRGRGQSWVVPYSDVELSVAPQPDQRLATGIVATVQDLRRDTARGPGATEHAVIYDVVIDVPVSWRKVDESGGGCVAPDSSGASSGSTCRGITYSLSDAPPVAGTASLFASINSFGCDSKGSPPTRPARLEVFNGIDVVHRVCPDDETYVFHGELNSEQWLSTPRDSPEATAAVRSMRRIR